MRWSRYGDGPVARRLSGFRYTDGEGHQAATPRDPAVGEAFDELRQATRVHDRAPWDACVLRVRRDTGKLKVEGDMGLAMKLGDIADIMK